MNNGIFIRSMGFLVAALAVAAFSGCDEGKGGGTGGSDGGSSDGGTGNTTNPGTGGAGNTMSTGGQPPAGDLSMIDDMEDADGSILATEGRKGAWYTYNDETPGATQMPEVMTPFEMAPINPPRGQSAFAARTNGSGFTTWGSGFGFDFSNDGVAKGAYDASAYKGISFWVKVGAGATGSIRVNLGDKNTTPEGGVCATGKCSDDFGKDIVATEEWKRFDILFSDMAQVGWSMVLLPSVEKSALYALHFQTGVDKTFDIWIDDVAFIK